MENASDALMMAFAVLIFVLALSITISSFSLARQTSQIIMDSTDRTYDYTYVSMEGTTREVGAETIVPTLYRAYKENYVIRFFEADGNPLYVYQRKVKGKYEPTNQINLEQEAIGNQQKATLFIDTLLNKYKLEDSFPNIKELDNLQTSGFYDIIKEVRFKEELGIYYIEDLKNERSNDDSSFGDYTQEQISNANKTEKRVITYTKIY